MNTSATGVALRALLWVGILATAKLIAGFLSGSVAVLGDGLHSAFDLALSGLTLFAVRLAAKPPDANHPYGHGRIENLAALAQSAIMLLVGAGVAAEAVRRLVTGVEATAPAYAYGVTIGALVIGIWRASVVGRAAKRFSSPALEADAANMTADVAESVAVIIGLAATSAGFSAADPAAALFVVFLMWAMAVRIGLRAVNILMDRAPEDLESVVTGVAAEVSGVVEVSEARVRRSGADVHAEVVVSVGRTSSVEQSHDITEAIEAAVAEVVPGATTTVHVEPSAHGEDIVSATFAAANRLGMADQVHNVLAIAHPEGLWLMLHAKVPPETPLAEAHRVTDALEQQLRSEIAGLARVEIHLEPREPQAVLGEVISTSDPRFVKAVVTIAESHRPISRCHEVAVSRTEDGLHLILHCEADPAIPIYAIHEASLKVEDEIHRRYGEVKTVTVHFEPQQGRSDG